MIFPDAALRLRTFQRARDDEDSDAGFCCCKARSQRDRALLAMRRQEGERLCATFPAARIPFFRSRADRESCAVVVEDYSAKLNERI
jgi:hypothetical protein